MRQSLSSCGFGAKPRRLASAWVELDYFKQLNAGGLMELEDVQGGQPETITDFDELEDGKTYLLDTGGSSITTSMRQYASSLQQENETARAVERDVQEEEEGPTAASQPHLRVLKDSSGRRDEMEVDCVIVGEDTAFVGSHKSTFTGPSMVKEVADKASTSQRKGGLPPGYAGTPYASFQGKEVVPVFMAENVKPEKLDILRKSCREQGVRLYRRTGDAIGVWACMKQLARGAVASRGAMRRVL